MGHMGNRVPAGPRQRGGSAAKEEAAARNKRARQHMEEKGGRTILDLGRLTDYRPTHAGSHKAYEGLLLSVCCLFYVVDHSHSLAAHRRRWAARSYWGRSLRPWCATRPRILGVLKDDSLRDPKRRSRILESLLGISAPI